MTTDAPPSPRVLLLASCFADAASSMDLAVAAAVRTGACLEGVLAFDPRAEAAAVVTVGHRGRAGPAPTGGPMRLPCGADARAFRQRLGTAAARASLRWGFRIETGLLPHLALGMRQPGDTVILGHSRFLPMRAPVVALAGTETDPTVRLAADLARALHLSLCRLPADTPPAGIDLLAASAIVLPGTLQDDLPRLDLLMEAARCPLLLSAAE